MNPALAGAIYDDLLPGWRDARLVSGNRRIKCPFHDDQDPSFDIHEENLNRKPSAATRAADGRKRFHSGGHVGNSPLRGVRPRSMSLCPASMLAYSAMAAFRSAVVEE